MSVDKARTRRIARLRIRSSGFPCVKTLSGFDRSFRPSVPRPQIEELATLRFANLAELFVRVAPIGLLEDLLGVEPLRENEAVDLVVVLVGNIVVADAELVGAVEHVENAPLRHLQALGYRVARVPRGPQLQHRFRLDFCYHINLLVVVVDMTRMIVVSDGHETPRR